MRVAIIGAGIAGLTTAVELRARGVQADIYEKSKDSGGRLATKRLKWGQIDTGAQYFTARDERFRKKVAAWEAQGIVSRWEFTPRVLENGHLRASPDNILRYVGTPSMNSIAHALAEGFSIYFNTHICQLKQVSDRWTLLTTEGERHGGYDWVIASCPAEQTIPLLAEKTTLVEHIPSEIHGPCWALALATSGKISASIQGIFGDETVSWVSRLSAHSDQQKFAGYDDLWMLHFSPQWSGTNGKETPVDVTATGLEWLQNTLGTSLTLVNAYQHYWRYASIIPRQQIVPRQQIITGQQRISVLKDKKQRIAVTGAWCCGGRVEGAYLSALNLVDEMFA